MADPEFVEVDYDVFGDAIPLRHPPSADALRAVIRERQGAYHRLFVGQPMPGDVQVVMDDLAVFCRAYETPFYPDQRLTDVAIGRGEVYRRIVEYTRLSNDELFHRYHQRALNGGKT